MCQYCEKEKSIVYLKKDLEKAKNLDLQIVNTDTISVETVLKNLEDLKSDLYAANNIISDYIDTTAKQDKMIEILLDLYWNKEQVRLLLEYGLESKEQLKKEIEKKAEEEV